MRSRSSKVALWACALWLAAAAQARAAVYLSVEEALQQAFPDAEQIEKRAFILTEAQKEQIQTLASAPLDSQLLTVNVATKGGSTLGYAVVDIHTVRTVQQALMVAMRPDGSLSSLRVLAFYEPAEYLPTDRFREQYLGQVLGPELQLGSAIQGVAGATLSSVATTRAVRRSLAIVEALFAPSKEAASAPAGDGAPQLSAVGAAAGSAEQGRTD